MSFINRYGVSIAIGMNIGHFISSYFNNGFTINRIKVLEDENKNILNSIDNSWKRREYDLNQIYKRLEQIQQKVDNKFKILKQNL